MADEPRRFFVPRGSLRARNVTLTGELAHRLARVLRLRRGDRVVLTEGGPREYEVQLTNVSPQAVTGVVAGERPSPPEPGVEVVLYQALIRPNRFDLVLEKGTEVGVARFVPMTTARSQGQMEEASAGRGERWARLITEAAEQCGRGRLPEVGPLVTFEEALRAAGGLKLLPYEEERRHKLADRLRALPQRPRTVSLLIGPEGGFEAEEVRAATASGAEIVTLGRRVLRSETAAIVAAAIVLHELDG